MIASRVRLTFPEPLVREPVIGRLVRLFDVMPNIRRADVKEDLGWMVLELDGEAEAVEAALAWLAGLGVIVDQLDHPLES
jgi:ABC-type methionine transport system ATPase subunit